MTQSHLMRGNILESQNALLSTFEPKKKKRNPPWTRDELILALDLYLRHRLSAPHDPHQDVAELSAFLGRMGKLLGIASQETFRNENGVTMKMSNFSRLDPAYTADGKVGLQRGNQDEQVVWNEFADAPLKLQTVVTAIRAAVDDPGLNHPAFAGEDDPETHEAQEGKVLTRLHRIRERNRKLVKDKKKAVMVKLGCLRCEACGFDFAEKYGPTGNGLIDVHHTKPIHTLRPGDVTRLDDLALLCANCHRMVHSSRQWLTVEQLKKLVRADSHHT